MTFANIATIIKSTLAESLGDNNAETVDELTSRLVDAINPILVKIELSHKKQTTKSAAVKETPKKTNRISTCMSRFTQAKKGCDEEFITHVFPLTIPEIAPDAAGTKLKTTWNETYLSLAGTYVDMDTFIAACKKSSLLAVMRQNALVYSCIPAETRDQLFPVQVKA